MRRVCGNCHTMYYDEFVSTNCPHKGIGYCVVCDSVVCYCPNDTRNPRSNKYGKAGKDRNTGDSTPAQSLPSSSD